MKKIIVPSLFAALGLLAMSFAFTNSGDPEKADKVVGIKIGDLAPEISMNNPDGEEMNLSDLRGQYVLVDFWASWCGPCRRENPNVVRAYDKYQKAKFKDADGFTVFSVSLDGDKGRWESAIEKDKLAWKYHVSDLQKWNNAAAKKYQVTSIPRSFLINPDGEIVATNLRGPQIDMALDKYVKKLK